MKKIILLLSLLSSSTIIYSQETEFKFVKEGFTDFVITQCEGKTQSELYKKALDWVSVTFKNPKEVIKAQIENDYIRIEGSSKNLVCFNAMGKSCNTAKYNIEISFKDGKYKSILDGNHRAYKAIKNKNKTIKVRELDLDSKTTPKIYKKLFNYGIQKLF